MIYLVLNMFLIIVFKLIVKYGGKVIYCGIVYFGLKVKNFCFNIECDMLIMDN